MKKHLHIALCFLVLAAAPRLAGAQTDEIFTTDGFHYQGKMVSDTGKFVEFSIESGVIKIPQEKISKIITSANKNHAEPETNYLQNTFVFGGSLGTPGGINIIGGYYWNRIGFRLEAGTDIELSGGQVDISYILSRKASFLTELSLILNYYGKSNRGESVWGVGPGWSLNAGGFFLQVGVAFGAPTIPLFQIGYVH